MEIIDETGELGNQLAAIYEGLSNKRFVLMFCNGVGKNFPLRLPFTLKEAFSNACESDKMLEKS